jgi:hypothetical protein
MPVLVSGQDVLGWEVGADHRHVAVDVVDLVDVAVGHDL